LSEPGRPFDPTADFAALVRMKLGGGDWDNGAAVFVRLRAFLHALSPAVVIRRQLPDPPDAPGGRTGAVAVTAGRKADDAIRGTLKETLTGRVARCSVP